MDMKDVEIFRSGTWNGERHTATDLDEMVAAFDKVGYRPPVKLGHKEDDSEPAYGWVTALRRVGEKLLADFTDIPEQIAQSIRERRYDAVSAEIFFNLKRGGQLFRRALKAVALLGAAIPGVAGLKPLRESFQGLTSADYEQISFVNFTQETGMDLKELQDKVAQLTRDMDAAKGDPAKLATLTQQLAATTTQIAELAQSSSATTAALAAANAQIATLTAKQRKDDIEKKAGTCRIPALKPLVAALYAAVLDKGTKVMRFSVTAKKDEEVDAVQVLDELVTHVNSQAEKLFKETAGTGGQQREEGEEGDVDLKDPQAVSFALDEKVKVYRAEHKDTAYPEALKAVMALNKELAQAYTQSRVH